MNPMLDEDAIVPARTRLEAATVWIVREGVQTLASRGSRALSAHFIAKWRVQMWVEPQLPRDGGLAVLRLKARGIHHDIKLLARRRAPDCEYEFWVAQRSAEAWAAPTRGCRFFVTATPCDGARKIVDASELFIASYQSEGGDTVSFPVEDLGALYELKAWRFPECFGDTDLKHVEVYVDQQRTFRTRRL